MSKPVILTGLRANNELHIGNYLGALLPLIDMAKTKAGDYQINLFIPDLHSFTTPIDHKQLQSQIKRTLKVFVAAGLPIDNDNVFIYRQSYIPAHSELTWILDCFTGFGEMRRMTQFKDKAGIVAGQNNSKPDIRAYEAKKNSLTSDDFIAALKDYERSMNDYVDFVLSNKRNEENVTVGLFNYPVLMAADILLYGAEYVPVGDDQTQHLEFTRDIAERLNAKFGDLFVVPKPVKDQHEFFGKDQGLRIRNLQDPTKKMSKSDDSEKGIIFLSDSPEEARKKVMSAETDSLSLVKYDYANQPGISNLLDLLKLFGGNQADFIGQTQYGPLKTAVADQIANFLKDFQTKLAAVDDKVIQHKLEASELLLHDVATQRLHRVQQAVGLRP